MALLENNRREYVILTTNVVNGNSLIDSFVEQVGEEQ